jgi:transcriptional regulator with XRE-family HTH domain
MAQTVEYRQVVDYLIKLRQERGLLQADLAKRLGQQQQFVSRVENRLRRLDVIEFYMYVRALGVDPLAAISEIYQQVGEAERT